jgi:hypothetical protein
LKSREPEKLIPCRLSAAEGKPNYYLILQVQLKISTILKLSIATKPVAFTSALGFLPSGHAGSRLAFACLYRIRIAKVLYFKKSSTRFVQGFSIP